MRLAGLPVLSMLLALALALALGSGAASASPLVPTNIPGVATIPLMDSGFDPLNASQEALTANGFPPRPDVVASPHAVVEWQRAVTAGARRVLPSIRMRSVRHGPRIGRGISNGVDASYNWSGFAVLSGASGYGASSFYYVLGDFVVPVAQQAFGACTGQWVFSSAWVGIDGISQQDVLQAGIDADAVCVSGYTFPYYSAWIEWYPGYEMEIDGFPIAQGNDIFVQVWNTSPTNGYAFFLNYTTNLAVTLNFTAPSGTALVGNSAEWIVERPSVGTALATLTNYTQDFWENAYAADFAAHGSAPGAVYPGNSSDEIVMYDNANTPISFPNLLGPSGIWFFDANSAQNASSP